MSQRIGLVGFNVQSGLGELNRQLATYADVDTWLVRPHRSFPTLPDHPNVDTIHCPTGFKVQDLIDKVDTVLFCETPYYSQLTERAKELDKRVVCVPMQEWMPEDLEGWPSHVDLFICPTKYCFNQFKDKLPCVYFPWPVDTLRFTYQQRTTVKRFLFIPGNGGYQDRKGCAVIDEARRLWPDMPLITPQNVQDNQDLYKEGDILLCPHSCDGLGLEPMEALACGIPVVVPWGQPWNELPAIARIESRVTKRHIKREVDWWTIDPQHLVNLCKELLGEDISWASGSARIWAETRAWQDRAEQFTYVVKHGAPCTSCPV